MLKKNKSDIHSVLFRKDKYDTRSARSRLKNHNLKPIKKVHTTKNFYRYRIRDPTLFKSFMTKKIDDIELIIGFY